MRTAELASDTLRISRLTTRNPVTYFMCPPWVRANRFGSLCVMREAGTDLFKFMALSGRKPQDGNFGSRLQLVKIEPQVKRLRLLLAPRRSDGVVIASAGV